MPRKSRPARPRSSITYLTPRGTFKSSPGRGRQPAGRGADRTAPPSASGAIYFERGSAIPRREDLAVLKRHARRLSLHPRSVLLIRGYSNRRSAGDRATRLAEARAAVVRMLLLAMGAKERQLDTSVGGVVRVTAATTRESRAQNRRVSLQGPYAEVGAALSGESRSARGKRRAA